MAYTRRELAKAVTTAGLAALSRTAAGTTMPVKAVAFDAFPILDARPVWALAEELFPGRGAAFSDLWRIRQFEYAWLRTLSRRYIDFWSVTRDALTFTATALQVELTGEKRELLMNAWLKIKCWPDVPDALRALKKRGIRLAFLSNLTTTMLETGIHNSGLENLFDRVLSTDRVQAYKPDSRAYQMAIDAFRLRREHLRREQIVFAGFAGWDVAGAKAFGYRTFWVNRQNQPMEHLGLPPDATGATLDDLVAYLNGQARSSRQSTGP